MQRPTGADSCDRDGFWRTRAILALFVCQLCSVGWWQIATGPSSRQEKAPEPRGGVGSKQVLLHIRKRGVEILFKAAGMVKCYPSRCFILRAKSCGRGSN